MLDEKAVEELRRTLAKSFDEDTVQEALLAFVRHVHHRQIDNPIGWCLSTAKRIAIRSRQRQARARERHAPLTPSIPTAPVQARRVEAREKLAHVPEVLVEHAAGYRRGTADRVRVHRARRDLLHDA